MITCFSKKKIISLILIIFIILLIIIFFVSKKDVNQNVEGYLATTNEIKNTDESINTSIWQIQIPKINLIANISEGTTNEILNEFVGHFEETAKDNGNIGLAGHNRGYKVNYFENLKDLNKGDEIIYLYNGVQRKYVVDSNSIIKDTDWSKLENTTDNRITLITCVENQPEYRRCIQGIMVIDP